MKHVVRIVLVATLLLGGGFLAYNHFTPKASPQVSLACKLGVSDACPHCPPGECCKMVLDKPRCQKCSITEQEETK
jgi:hypothetical protein